MPLKPVSISEYHVFLASPGDVDAERREVRAFFDEFNRNLAARRGLRFVVIDWENYSTSGVGRAQQLITAQTLEKYRDSLALVVGLMGQRFGSPSGRYESGTEEELLWALDVHLRTGFPEIKWFFKKYTTFSVPFADPDAIQAALDQWRKVLAFKARLQEGSPATGQPQLYFKEFADLPDFRDVLRRDLTLWMSSPDRPWS
jgi:hypothetical protein